MIQPDYLSILPELGAISLDEMDSVKLMSRMDQKFLAHSAQLSDLLLAAKDSYHILEIAGIRQMGYESLYFDTDGHQMYIHHHNRKLNRHKIRIRQYLDSEQFFLEIKFKSNKGRTRKTRIPVENYEALNTEEGAAFVASNSFYQVQDLSPKLYTTFKRITLVSQVRAERVTIDTDLQLHYQGQSFELPSLTIIELKSERLADPGGFKDILREQRIFAKKLSKYCTATNLLYPGIKRNRFLPKLRYLNKLERINKHLSHATTV